MAEAGIGTLAHHHSATHWNWQMLPGGLSKIHMDHFLWNMYFSKSLKLPMMQFGIILKLLLVNRYIKEIKISAYFD